MFTLNEGTFDRALRILVGLGLLAWYFLENGSGFWHYAKLIGVLPLLTGLLGTCPVYSLFGISTCPTKSAP